MALEALFDAVIVKPIEIEETTFGNIIVPDLGKEKNETAEIISVGPGRMLQDGTMKPLPLSVGDRVVLPTMGFTKLPYEGEEYYVGPGNQILAKISETVSVKEIIEETKVSEIEKTILTDI
jgi:chaperonin GroES|tara:strand:+ start:183 stop:545 length:363 start_codon:yes stop_codon:yes gene_type:complete